MHESCNSKYVEMIINTALYALFRCILKNEALYTGRERKFVEYFWDRMTFKEPQTDKRPSRNNKKMIKIGCGSCRQHRGVSLKLKGALYKFQGRLVSFV